MRETFLAVCFTTNFGVRENSLYADFRGGGSAVSPALEMTEKDILHHYKMTMIWIWIWIMDS